MHTLNITRMPCSVLILTTCILLAAPTTAVSDSKTMKMEKIKRDQARRLSEMKRKAALRKQKTTSSSSAKKTTNSTSSRSRSSRTSSKSSDTKPKFNPDRAPSPEKCFADYVKAVRSASTMTPLLPWMLTADRETLVRQQEDFDPRWAKERKKKLIKEGKMDRDLIERISMSPYEKELYWRRTFVDNIISINSSRIDGDKAEVVASIRINDTIDGKKYTRSTATIGLVGEGSRWYYQTYKESCLATN